MLGPFSHFRWANGPTIVPTFWAKFRQIMETTANNLQDKSLLFQCR
ncbi:hypothetical protein SKA58_18650 [Sphingomonas sp. SKA58]|nr:hypothetical protein SKA58_18650 [Sphingomonas sp. SKA58]